ncbi:M20 family metallopeptidase [Cytobacillus firmus]|uniref:Peptidase M20 n=1 Tax=Cytobacillus firmus DS1 TaxID=1307436 RepID=W7L467_CYTFI|nr:M20 family metallopeptidase [Cytobacillus firmus]EWG09962.1 peptidase M20 [Cytobacillus firmus DS1]
MLDIFQALKEKEEASLHLLKEFVELESFSFDKQGVDNLSTHLIRVFSEFPVKAESLKEEHYGNHLRFQLGEGEKQLLLLSHLDTVYPRGTIERMPFQVEGKKARGPGVIDIKASYVMVYHLFELLLQQMNLKDYQIVWLLTSDEEVGSPTGKLAVKREAARSEAVLVLEPAADNRALKTARKGGGKFTIEVNGISAHAGLNPQDGANAIEELAFQITKIISLADWSKGTTINTGEIKGGSLFNVVADYARAEIDVRIEERDEIQRIQQAFDQLRVRNPRTRLNVTGSIYRPPLIKTELTGRLFKMAERIGRDLDVSVEEAMVGGGSDGNYAAETGAPVLDGLGGYGGGAHSPDEFLWIESLAERTSILYGLIQELIQLDGTWR